MKEGRYLLSLFGSSRDTSPTEIDLDLLSKLAEDHGVVPLTTMLMGENPPTNLEQRAKQLAVRSLEYERALRKILKLLSQHNIEALFLKGVALSYSAYDNPSQRTVNDIDLLVGRRDLERVDSLLQENGYQRVGEYSQKRERVEIHFQDAREYYDSDHNLQLDLHWKLVKDFYSLKLPIKQFFDRAITIETNGLHFKTLAPEDHLLFLCIHGGKHSWNELKWTIDIQKLLAAYPDIDLPTTLRRAEKIGAKRLLLLGLSLMQKITGTSLPDHIIESIKADSKIKKLTLEIIGILERNEEYDVLNTIKVDLDMRERIRDKASYLFKRILYPHAEDWRALNLPDLLFPLYYVVRPFRLLFRYAMR